MRYLFGFLLVPLGVIAIATCIREPREPVRPGELDIYYGGGERIISPGKLAIYFGQPSKARDPQLPHCGKTSVECAIDVFSTYDLLVLGDVLAFPRFTGALGQVAKWGCDQNAHIDHDDTKTIIKELIKRGTQVYGAVPIGGENTASICPNRPLSIAEIKSWIDRWVAMEVTGVFLDEAGYDFGTTRKRQSEIIEYAHATKKVPVFVNAWRPEDIFDDKVVGKVKYVGRLATKWSKKPMNPNGAGTLLGRGDIFLHESFQVQKTPAVWQPVLDPALGWWPKSELAWRYKRDHGTKMATISTTSDTGPNCIATFMQERMNYVWYSTWLHNFDYIGWGEAVEFSASGSCADQLPYRKRPHELGTSDPGYIDKETITGPYTSKAKEITAGEMYARETKCGTLELDTKFHSGTFRASASPPQGCTKAP
jgi:hypothetical protein